MFKDFIHLCIDLISDFIRDFNSHATYIEEYRPKTYGTRIRR